MSKLEDEIIDLIRKFFKQKSIDDNSNINTIKNWDSLNHVNLINLIAQEYSIKISFVEMVNISSVKDILKIVKKKL
jgi:acyl carrier protein